MNNTQGRQSFLKSDKATVLRDQLIEMTKSPLYNTKVQGITDTPDDIRFIEKHMNYMSSFPKMDHLQYISNLKLMTKRST
jgi:hypothetical protein